MSEENKYMDDSFKKMNEEFKVSYDNSFWNEMQANLDNEAIDSAFRAAASKITVTASAGTAGEGLSDAFMDDAFNEAATSSSVTYNGDYWSQFEASAPDLMMNEAYLSAAKQVKSAYDPTFWGEANSALEKEGLHHEYKEAYWAEAKGLLDKADQSQFYFRWAAAATLLLLFSAIGLNGWFNTEYGNTNSKQDTKGYLAEKEDSRQLEDNNNENTTRVAQSDPVNQLNNPAQNSDFNLAKNEVKGNVTVNSSVLSKSGNDVLIANSLVVDAENEISNQNGNKLNQTAIQEDVLTNNTEAVDQTNGGFNGVVDHINTTQVVDMMGNQSDNHGVANNTVKSDFDNSITKTDVARVNRDYKLLGLTNSAILSNAVPFAEIQSIKPAIVHTISVFGGIGLGHNYGDPSVQFTNRYNAGIQYLRQGNGALRNFEIGVSVVVNKVDFEGLRASQLKKYPSANGEVPRAWYDAIFYNSYSAGVNYLMNYKINRKHKLLFGLGVDYVLGVNTNLSYLKSEDVEIQTYNKNWGVKNGMTKLDANLSFGYEFQPIRQLGITVKTNFGLRDRTKNDFFLNDLRYNNEMNFTVGLRYTLFTRI